MHRLCRLFIFCLLTSLCGAVYAQSETSQPASTAIISADKDQPYGNVQSAIELLNNHSIQKLSFRLTETPGLTVSITTMSKAEIYTELKSLLQKAGVDNTEILPAPMEWIDFSFSELERKRKTTGAIVMLRADWCPTCQQLETKTFAESDLLRLIRESGVPFMKADFTDSDEQSEQLAKQVGTKLVPAFVVYPPNGSEKPVVMHNAIDSAAISKMLKDNFPSKPQAENPIR